MSEPAPKVPMSSVFTGRPWLLPTITGIAGVFVGVGLVALLGLVASVSSTIATPTVFNDALTTCNLTDSSNSSIDDDGYSLTVESKGDEDSTGLGYDEIMCILKALDAPAAVMSHFEQTTAMDGRQEESWDDLKLSWSYHPDRGADYVVTLDHS